MQGMTGNQAYIKGFFDTGQLNRFIQRLPSAASVFTKSQTAACPTASRSSFPVVSLKTHFLQARTNNAYQVRPHSCIRGTYAVVYSTRMRGGPHPTLPSAAEYFAHRDNDVFTLKKEGSVTLTDPS